MEVKLRPHSLHHYSTALLIHIIISVFRNSPVRCLLIAANNRVRHDCMVYVIFSLSLSVCLSVSLSLSVSLCTSLFSVLNFCAVFLPAVADLRIEFFIEIFKTFPPPSRSAHRRMFFFENKFSNFPCEVSRAGP